MSSPGTHRPVRRTLVFFLLTFVFSWAIWIPLAVTGSESGALSILGRFGPLGASLVIGLVWGVWHAPLFWMAGDFHADIPFGLFLLQDVALSVVMTWLFNGTGGSLLLIHLFHAASNTSIGVLPVLPQDTGGDLRPLRIAIVLLWVVAGVIVVSTRSWRRDRVDRA
jgi:uncharacterized protein